MGTLWRDIKYAFRQLRKSPGFITVAVLSLALGIGANTAIFSLLNAVWMRSLPVQNPHELRIVNWSGHNVSLPFWTAGAADGVKDGVEVHSSFPYPLYRDFKEQVKGCSEVFAFFGLHDLTIVGPKGASKANGMMVSGNFFEGYGAQAWMGRAIAPSDESTKSDPVVVITHLFWEKEYNLDPAVIGKMLTINGYQFTIIGVMPRSYSGPEIGDMTQLYLPMSVQPLLDESRPLDSRDHWWINIMTRVEPDADETQIQAAMEGLFLQTLSAPGQGSYAENPHILLVNGSRGLLGIRRYMATDLTVLMIAVGLVLLIACANLAGLLLARGEARQQEFAIRASMGAGRGRLIRQLLTESLVLSLVGAVLGLLIALWMKSLIMAFMLGLPASFSLNTSLDLRVLLFTLATAVITSLLFGLLPALRVTRLSLADNLKGKRTLGIPGLRLGKVLVAAQVSLSVLLVVGTGLLMRTLINLHQTELGFNTDNILVFGLSLGQAGYQDVNSVQFYDKVRTRIASLPSVKQVSLSSNSLLGGCCAGYGFTIPGRTEQDYSDLMADCLNISETFFETMGIPLLRGRTFEQTDIPSQPGVVIINEAFVRTYFPDEDPLYQSIRMGNNKLYQIVGICADAKYNDVRRDFEPTLYFSHRQANPEAMFFEVLTSNEPLTLVPAVRQIITDLDRTIPMESVSTQSQLFKDSISLERFFTILCSSLAVLGIALSCIGLYGLLAFMVTRRMGEFGVRLALGARPSDIAWPVIRNALWLAGFGLMVGIPMALCAARLLSTMLYGVTPNDPMTIVLSVLLILLVASIAAWIPARRAAKINPMEALRYE
jgi:predicted permease